MHWARTLGLTSVGQIYFRVSSRPVTSPFSALAVNKQASEQESDWNMISRQKEQRQSQQSKMWTDTVNLLPVLHSSSLDYCEIGEVEAQVTKYPLAAACLDTTQPGMSQQVIDSLGSSIARSRRPQEKYEQSCKQERQTHQKIRLSTLCVTSRQTAAVRECFQTVQVEANVAALRNSLRQAKHSSLSPRCVLFDVSQRRHLQLQWPDILKIKTAYSAGTRDGACPRRRGDTLKTARCVMSESDFRWCDGEGIAQVVVRSKVVPRLAVSLSSTHAANRSTLIATSSTLLSNFRASELHLQPPPPGQQQLYVVLNPLWSCGIRYGLVIAKNRLGLSGISGHSLVVQLSVLHLFDLHISSMVLQDVAFSLPGYNTRRMD
ncbi:hypothetical protein BC835DRAFT_1308378 [Cytidiella melzeri]|nr:hypothetical protein BC835DRAFT_1308378 [Cytidiella melzeri]